MTTESKLQPMHEWTELAVTGFTAGLMLMLGALGSAMWSVRTSWDAEEWVEHTREVSETLSEFLSYLQAAETDQRGYIITGEDRYLQPYQKAVEDLPPTLDRLARLTSDNTHQQARIAELRPVLTARLTMLRQAIEQRRVGGFEAGASVIRNGRGEAAMDHVRAVTADMKDEELRLLAHRHSASALWRRRAIASTAVLAGVGLLSITLAIIAALRSRGMVLTAYQRLKESDHLLRCSETRYRRLFEAAQDGVLLMDPDTRRITDANPFMTRLLGYSHEELVGKELYQIGLLRDEQASQEAFQQLQGRGYIRYEDLPLQTKTGDVREVEFVSNVYDEDGRSVIQCNIRDVSERKAFERQFQALFESAPGSYLVLRPGNYEIVAVSDAYLNATMTQREDIIGKRLFDVFPDAPDDHEASGVRSLSASLERVTSTLRSDVMAVQFYPIRRPASEGGHFEQRWWSPINAPVLGPAGELAYIIHRVEDVTSVILAQNQKGQMAEDIANLDATTQRMQAELVLRAQDLEQANEALRHRDQLLNAANRELTDFATIVSHDLKSPLRAVATLAKWIQSDYADKLDEEGRDNLAEMVKRVARMDRMIEGILQYSRVGRIQENPEQIPTADLVPTIVEDLNPPSNVRVDLAPEMPVVWGDPVRLRQVFQNMIGNAIKYADKPLVEIKIGWADCGALWHFWITDNGCGIEGRHFERIFKMFQTLAPKDNTDSTGIGLALVRRIVEHAGGQVCMESHVGQGSAFHFTWPKAARSFLVQHSVHEPGLVGAEIQNGARL